MTYFILPYSLSLFPPFIIFFYSNKLLLKLTLLTLVLIINKLYLYY